MKRLIPVSMLAAGFVFAQSALAEVPVVDGHQVPPIIEQALDTEVPAQSFVTRDDKPSAAKSAPVQAHDGLDLLSRVTQLESELQRVNGLLEEQTHQLSQFRKSQTKWYQTLDAKLSQLLGNADEAKKKA